jgi:hypothetical protein
MLRALTLGLLAIAGCAPAIPRHTVHVPPLAADLAPPRSVLFLNADLPLDGLRAALEQAVPPRTAGGGSVALGALGNVETSWELERRPMIVRAQPGGLEVRLESRGVVTIGGRLGRCRADDAGIALDVLARPTLDRDGFIGLSEPRVTVQPIGELRCGPIPLPIGKVLEVAMAPIGRGVGELIERLRLPLAPLVRWGLDELRRPRALTIAGQEACLQLDPRGLVLSVGEGSAGEGKLAVRVGADVGPRLALGKCAGPTPERDYPVLVRNEALGDQFRVDVSLGVSYDELARRATVELAGKHFGDGARSVTVRSLELGDAGGRALARVEVTGALSGALFLWGTPRIVERGGQPFLEIPDLETAVESRDALTHLRLWAWKVWNGGLTVALRSKLSFPLSSRLDDARRALDRRLELVPGSPSLALRIVPARVEPVAVVSRPGALVAHFVLAGRAELELR